MCSGSLLEFPFFSSFHSKLLFVLSDCDLLIDIAIRRDHRHMCFFVRIFLILDKKVSIAGCLCVANLFMVHSIIYLFFSIFQHFTTIHSAIPPFFCAYFFLVIKKYFKMIFYFLFYLFFVSISGYRRKNKHFSS